MSRYFFNDLLNDLCEIYLYIIISIYINVFNYDVCFKLQNINNHIKWLVLIYVMGMQIGMVQESFLSGQMTIAYFSKCLFLIMNHILVTITEDNQ